MSPWGHPGWDVNLGWIGAAHGWLGDYDAAFEWLDRAIEIRSASLSEFKVDQLADALRSDPRFAILLRHVGLEEGA